MTASDKKKPAPAKQKELPVTKKQMEKHFGPVCQWHFVDHFHTEDEAERCVQGLLQDGHYAQHSLIDGLCVVARRDADELM